MSLKNRAMAYDMLYMESSLKGMSSEHNNSLWTSTYQENGQLMLGFTFREAQVTSYCDS